MSDLPVCLFPLVYITPCARPLLASKCVCQCGISVCIFCMLFCEGWESMCVCAGVGKQQWQPFRSTNSGGRCGPECAHLFGTDWSKNVHSDACVALSLAANYLFICASTHTEASQCLFKWMLNGLFIFFCCCRDVHSCPLTGTLLADFKWAQMNHRRVTEMAA